MSHWKQYPPNTTLVYSYFESRGGKYDEVCFFGLQYLLKKYLTGVVVTKEKIDQAEKLYEAHFMGQQFYREGWEYILNEKGGVLPVKICAVPEGTVVAAKTPLMTVENTDPKCFWLTNFLETLLVQVWAPMTVATHSREQKKVIQAYLEATADDAAMAGLGFKLHDFGFRGVSSVETAGINGAGHLVNFIGTDTVAAMNVAIEYYGAPCGPNPTPDVFPPFLCPGYSIPASEHSTITSWTKDGELDALRNMLEQYPVGIVACVSDSFDVFKVARDASGAAPNHCRRHRRCRCHHLHRCRRPLPPLVTGLLRDVGNGAQGADSQPAGGIAACGAAGQWRPRHDGIEVSRDPWRKDRMRNELEGLQNPSSQRPHDLGRWH